jgi:alpha-beta hydrolase superfamily lysophospholipase
MLKYAAVAVILSHCLAVQAQDASCKVDEKGYVAIGGIEQWVSARGDSCASPVLLVVHGGPGNPLSPYAEALYGAWSRDYIVVHWDQRGSGKTYGRSKPKEGEALTLRRLTEDGAEVASYAARHFGKKQVALFGSSWGSLLAVNMLKSRPELFSAYMGTAQIVGYRQNQSASYARTKQKVAAAGDQAALAVLDSVGAPPWTDPRSFGKVRRIIRKYEAQATTPAPRAWWTPAAEYATPQYQADYEAGEDYSFLNFVGLKGDGMFSQADLAALGPDFAMPVFILQGEEDLLCTPEVTRAWYATLRAPLKELIMVPRAGHDPNPDMIAAQTRVLKELILPLLR